MSTPQNAPVVASMGGRKIFVTSNQAGGDEGNIDPVNLPVSKATQEAVDGTSNKLGHFYGQLSQTKKLLSNPPVSSFPRTSRLSMVTTGDSLAALGFDFGILLQRQFGIGGYGLGMLGFNLSGGATQPDDHGVWVRGLHFSVPTGGSVTFNANRGGAFTGDIEVFADTFKVFYKTVSGATLTLESSVDRGANWVNVGTVDCSSGNVAKFSATLAQYLIRITGATGNSIVFGAEMSVDEASSSSNSNYQGVVLHDISRSGTTPDQLVEMDAATFGVIMAEVAPVLGFHTNADHQPENEIYLVEMMDRLRSASPDMDNLMVSSNPSDQLSAEKSVNADWMRSYQEEQGNGYAFFDAYNFGGDFSDWDANGFANDIVHASSSGRRLISSAIYANSQLESAWQARETHGTQNSSVKRLIGVDGIDQRAGATTGGSNQGLRILGKNTNSRLGFETPAHVGHRGWIAHENGDMSVEVGTNTLMTFFSTGRVAISRKNSSNGNNSQPTANGPWFEVESLDAFNSAMRVVARSSASDTRNAFEIYRGADLVARFTSAGWLVPETPEYADNAAADAASLPSGGFYRLTGDRTVYRKP